MSRYASSSSSSSYYRKQYNHHQHPQQQSQPPSQSLDAYSSSSSHRFSLSDSDFQRDAVLKRQRYLSPARAAASSNSSSASHNNRTPHHQQQQQQHQQQQPPHRPGSSGTRPERQVPSSTPAPAPAPPAPAPASHARGRSKSKGRMAPQPPQPPKPSSSEFIALGRSANTTNTNKATYYGGGARVTTRSRSRSVAAAVKSSMTRRSPSTHRGHWSRVEEEERTRARERERELERDREALSVPKVALAKAHAPSKSARRSVAKERARSKSKSKARSSKAKSSRRSPSSSSSDNESSSSSSEDARRSSRKRSKVKSTRKASAKRASSSSSSLSPRRASSRRSKSKSKARRSAKDERGRGKSKSRARSSAAPAAAAAPATFTSSNAATRESINTESERIQRALGTAKTELQKLQDEMDELQKRMESKKYQIKHLELDLEVVEKRKRIELEYSAGGGRAAPDTRTAAAAPVAAASHRDSDQQRRSASRTRTASKRPCIVDTDESDSDEVVFLDPVQFKQERPPQKRQRSSSKPRSSKASGPAPVQVPMDTSLVENAERKEIPDFFWGKAETAKLLAQHKVRTIPDGHVRKIRHLAFNPMKSDYFATSSDDGGMVIWSYERPTHEISKMGTFAPSSFRRDNQCAESIVWSPDGNRLAMAFRDPLNGKGEFCVVLLHNLPLTGSEKPQDIPRDRVTSMTTTLHSRGISAIEWIPSGHGNDTTSRSLVTAGSDHAVVLWEEHDDANNDYKWRVLHREHRAEVKAICVHSQRQDVYTGGFDGQVVRYDLHKFASQVVMERRKPSISKINAVLEHPHNPNILLVSAIEQSEHNILLHDLRQRYSSSRDATMTLSRVKASDSRSMSQYIVPRWSPAGMHVSCGSKSGLVNIWDVRVRGPTYPVLLPQQSIAVHQKTVLHATWHPRYNALFSVSNDRTLGLLTFSEGR